MRFNNEQFEKNCAQSMSTLDKLKEKIDNTGSGECLSKLGDAANNVDLTKLENAVEAVNNKFSILGVIGATIVSDLTRSVVNMAKNIITAVPNIIKEKGWTRAMNIEQAKFQLEGLGVAWKNVADDIDYAVSGTAYGLDAAAKACSQLVASGVQAGDAMKQALRGISGVAAMTNSEYEEIAPIFTTVAGQGKVMTMQLRQLENRGLNVAAVLAKSMGTTEAAVREMVKDGEINFAMFSKAMDDAFGEHAKDANKTFDGVLKNIKAALARIGADFFTPVIEEEGPIVKALQVLRQRIVDIKDAIQPTVNRWKAFVKEFGNGAETLLGKLNTKFFGNIVEGFANILTGLWQVLKSIGGAFLDVFGSEGNRSLQAFADGWERFTRALMLSKGEMEDLREIFRGVFSVVDLFTTVIKELLSAILGINPATIGFRQVLLHLLAVVSQLVQEFVNFIKESEVIQVTIQIISITLKALLLIILKVIEGFSALVTKASAMEGLQLIFKGLGIAIYYVVGVLALLINKLIEVGKAIASNNLESLGKLGDVIIFVRDNVLSLIDALGQLAPVQYIIGGIVAGINAIKNAVDNLFGNNEIAGEIRTISDEMVPLRNGAKGLITTVDQMKDKMSDASDKSEIVMDSIKKFGLTAERTADSIKKTNNSFMDFIENIPVGRIIALGFLTAVVLSLTNISRALNNVGRGIANIGGFFFNLQRTGLVGLLTGTGQWSRTPNHIMDIAIAIGVLAASMVALSKIPAKDLDSTIETLGKLAVGFVGVITVLTLLEKYLGFTGALDYIGIALLEIAASIGAIGIALAIIAGIDTSKIEGSVVTLVTIVGAMTALSILVSKYGAGISKMGMSFIAMGAGMLLLVKATESVLKYSNELVADVNATIAKLAAVGTMAVILSAVANVCDKVSGGAFLKLAVATLSLSVALEIISKLLSRFDDSSSDSSLVNTIKAFVTLIGHVVGYLLELASKFKSLIAVVVVLTALGNKWGIGLGSLISVFRKSKKSLDKAAKYSNYHKKALNTLANAGLVLAITASVAVLSLIILILSKAKLNENMEALEAALYAMTAIFIMIGSFLIVIGKYMSSVKGAAAAALATTIAFGAIVVSVVGIASYLGNVIMDEDWDELILMAGSLALVLGIIRNFANSIAKLKGVSINKTSMSAIVAMVAAVGVVAGSVYLLARSFKDNGGGRTILAIATLAGALELLTHLMRVITQYDHYTLKAQTSKTILALCAFLGTAAASLTILSRYGGSLGGILLSTIALGAIFAELVLVAKSLDKIKFDKSLQAGITSLCAMLATVTISLVALGNFGGGWANVLASMAAITIVMQELSAVTKAMSKVEFKKESIGAIIEGLAILTGGTLALIALSSLGGSAAQIMASMAAITVVVQEMSAIIKNMSNVKVSKEAWTSIAEGIVILASVTLALIALSKLGGSAAQIKASMAALSVTMISVAAVLKILSNVNVNVSAIKQVIIAIGLLAAVSTSLVIVSKALASLIQYDWTAIAATAVIMVTTVAALSGIAYLLGNLEGALAGAGILLLLSADLLIACASIAMLANYDWTNIAGIAATMVITMGLLAVAATVIGNPAIAAFAALGAVVMGLLGAAMIPLAYALEIGAGAILIFSEAAKNFVEAGREFIGIISEFLDILMVYPAEDVITTAGAMAVLGLAMIPFSVGLLAVGAASTVMNLGLVGLLGFAKTLPILASGMNSLKTINLAEVAEGIAAVALAALGLTVLSPIMLAASAASITLGASLLVLSAGIASLVKVVATAYTYVSGIIPSWIEAGKNVILGFWNGMKEIAGDVWDWATGWFDSLVDGAKDILGIHSPSAVFEFIGNMMGEGLDIGLEDGLDGIDEMLTGELGGYLDIVGGEETCTDFYAAGYEAGKRAGEGVGEGFEDMATAKAQVAIDRFKSILNSLFTTEYHGPGSDTTGGWDGSQDTYDWSRGFVDAIEEQLGYLDKAEDALTDYTDAVDGAGGASGKASEDVKKLSDAFSVISYNAKQSMEELENILVTNKIKTERWQKDVITLIAKGYNEATIEWVKEMGVAGHKTVKEFMKASEEEVAKWNDVVTNMYMLNDEQYTQLLESYREMGYSSMEEFYAGMELYDPDIAESVQNAVEPFEEFDKSTEITKNKLIANLQSQIDGTREWGNMMNDLYRRGLGDHADLYKYLEDMGPKGYQYVAAFSSMTDEEFQHACDLWDETMHLGIDYAKSTWPLEYEQIGANITEGLNDGIDFTDATNTMKQGYTDMTTAFAGPNGFIIQSPSKRMKDYGQNILIGLRLGIGEQWKFTINYFDKFCDTTIKKMEEYFNEDQGKDLGSDLIQGIINGLKSRERELYDIAYAIAEEAWKKAKAAVQSNSPSKRFMQLGEDMIEGEIIGLQNKEDALYGTVTEIGEGTISQMAAVISAIAENVNSEMTDISPVIKPRLDMSELQNGKSFISSLFNGGSIGLAEDIMLNRDTVSSDTETTSIPVAGTTQNIIFNQTNNSPKNIDPYESYRLGRLSLAQMKGALT